MKYLKHMTFLSWLNVFFVFLNLFCTFINIMTGIYWLAFFNFIVACICAFAAIFGIICRVRNEELDNQMIAAKVSLLEAGSREIKS